MATEPTIDIAASIREVAAYMKKKVTAVGIEMPHVYMEPGRSIVADAGLTLYTVGAVKKIILDRLPLAAVFGCSHQLPPPITKR